MNLEGTGSGSKGRGIVTQKTVLGMAKAMTGKVAPETETVPVTPSPDSPVKFRIFDATHGRFFAVKDAEVFTVPGFEEFTFFTHLSQDTTECYNASELSTGACICGYPAYRSDRGFIAGLAQKILTQVGIEQFRIAMATANAEIAKMQVKS